MVDFREEVAPVRSFEDVAAEGDSRSDCFPDDSGEVTDGDLDFRDVVIEIEGAADSGRREAALVPIARVDVVRLVGSAVGSVLDGRGDFEPVFVSGLVTFLTSFGGPVSVFAKRVSSYPCRD